MTAPTPSSPHDGPSRPDSPFDPWGTPPGGGDGKAAEAAGRAEVAREAADALRVAAVLTAAGVVLGLLWLWLAPRVPVVSDGTAVYLRNSEGEEAAGADGTFVLLALGFGALSGAAVFLARRRGGVGVAIGLAAGAVLGSVLAWRLGVWLGPGQDLAARAEEAGEGEVFDGPLGLRAKGALLVWPFAALAAHLALTGMFGPRDPAPEEAARPVHPGWGPAPRAGGEDAGRA
ncbi:ABC transporter permease [Streptomyces desertarenae]|uniref:ABC transporter permease n=1 Tax=Streptomyces desertarenae TaxID=2666184 RepID=A0ABW4PMN2_9ACTN